jgi:hypothetical protein
MAHGFWDVLMWTVVAAMVVLIVINASGVASLISSFGGFWTQETTILTGSGYKVAK